MSEEKLHHFQCTVCGYVYETEEDELPDDFVCPVCGVGKDMFVKLDSITLRIPWDFLRFFSFCTIKSIFID